MSRFSSKVCFIIALFLLGFLSNFLGALHSLERGDLDDTFSLKMSSLYCGGIPRPREGIEGVCYGKTRSIV